MLLPRQGSQPLDYFLKNLTLQAAETPSILWVGYREKAITRLRCPSDTRRWRLCREFSDLPRRHALHVEFADALLHLHGELPRLVLRGGGGVRRDLRAVRRQGGGGGGDLASFSAAVGKRL